MAVAPDPDHLADLLTGLGTVADPRWWADGRVAWVRSDGTRADLVTTPGAPGSPGWHALEGADPVGGPDPVGVSTVLEGVGGTRGATVAPAGDGLVAVAADGTLRVLGPDGAHRTTLAPRGRASAPAVHGDRVAYVDETDDECVIVVAPLDGSAPGRIVSRGADWSWDPAWSPDGRWLAWHEWDAPAMPWDDSRIVVAAADGADPVVVAGGLGEATGQPRFAPAGRARLAFVSDRDGWSTLHVVDGPREVAVRLASPEPREHAQPSWGPGQRSYAWSPDGTRLAWCRNEDGFGRLVIGVADALADGAVRERARGWHHGIDWGPHGIVAIRSGARTPPTVVVLDPDADGRTELAVAPGAAAWVALDPVEPEPVAWHAADGTEVTGLRYGPADRHRSLVVDVHGGPTDQAIVDWNPRLQAFVALGWTVLRPNPRGSTGRGRAYTQALRGEWGGADVGDVVAGIEAAIAHGWAGPGRVAAVGGSSGGLLALLAAIAAPDLVGAVVTPYPVTDLRALAGSTHRFEAHAHEHLVGPWPGAADRYDARSPVRLADRLAVPVLVLHGGRDPVVPLAQTEAFAAAVRAGGGAVEVHVYPDEGHGWRSSATVADAFRRSVAFLAHHLHAGAPPDRRAPGGAPA